MNDKNKNVSRRVFFTGVCRFGLLGIAGVFSAGYLAKRRRFLREGKCIGGERCAGCEILADCRLPIALKEKGIVENV